LRSLLLLWVAVPYAKAAFSFERAKWLDANGKSLEAIPYFVEAQRLDPGNPDHFYLCGQSRLKLLEEGMARQVLESIVRRALDDFERTSELYPQNIYNLMAKGNALDALGQHEEAGEAFELAVEWAPLYGTVLTAKGIHHLRSGELEEAEEVLEASLTAPAYHDHSYAMKMLRVVKALKKIEDEKPEH